MSKKLETNKPKNNWHINSIDYAFEKTVFRANFNRHKPSSNHWYNLNIGSSDAHISLLVNTQTNVIAVELYIPKNKELYDMLFENKDAVEAVIGTQLEWRRLDTKAASRILLSKKVNLKSLEEREEQFNWFMDHAVAYKKAFLPYF